MAGLGDREFAGGHCWRCQASIARTLVHFTVFLKRAASLRIVPLPCSTHPYCARIGNDPPIWIAADSLLLLVQEAPPLQTPRGRFHQVDGLQIVREKRLVVYVGCINSHSSSFVALFLARRAPADTEQASQQALACRSEGRGGAPAPNVTLAISELHPTSNRKLQPARHKPMPAPSNRERPVRETHTHTQTEKREKKITGSVFQLNCKFLSGPRLAVSLTRESSSFSYCLIHDSICTVKMLREKK